MTDASFKFVTACDGVQVWDYPASFSAAQPLMHAEPHVPGFAVRSARWNHNNQVIATVADDGLIALTHESGAILGRFSLATPVGESASVSPDEFAERHSALLARPLSAQPLAPVTYALAFSTGSRYLCTAGTSRTVDVWDLKHKAKLHALSGHSHAVSAVAFGPAEQTVASGSHNGRVLLHSAASGATIGEFSLSVAGASAPADSREARGVSDLAYAPAAGAAPPLLLTAHLCGSLAVWDISRAPAPAPSSSFSTTFAPLAAASSSSIAAAGARAPALTCARWHPSGAALTVAGLTSGGVLCWDTRSAAATVRVPTSVPATAVTSVDVAADGHTLLAASLSGTVDVIDLRAPRRPVVTLNVATGAPGEGASTGTTAPVLAVQAQHPARGALVPSLGFSAVARELASSDSAAVAVSAPARGPALAPAPAPAPAPSLAAASAVSPFARLSAAAATAGAPAASASAVADAARAAPHAPLQSAATVPVSASIAAPAPTFAPAHGRAPAPLAAAAGAASVPAVPAAAALASGELLTGQLAALIKSELSSLVASELGSLVAAAVRAELHSARQSQFSALSNLHADVLHEFHAARTEAAARADADAGRYAAVAAELARLREEITALRAGR